MIPIKMKPKLPQKNKSINNRFFKITQAAYIYGFIGHFILAFIFYFFQIIELMWFNILFSVPAFSISFFVNRLGRHSLAFLFAYTELLCHQIAGIYFLGWDFGFQFIFIYLAGLTFFNSYWKKWIRIFLFSIVFFSILVLYLGFKNSQVYEVPQIICDISYLTSCLSTLFAIALLINYYVHSAENAESNLRFANAQLDKAYKEVKQQKTDLKIRNNFI